MRDIEFVIDFLLAAAFAPILAIVFFVSASITVFVISYPLRFCKQNQSEALPKCDIDPRMHSCFSWHPGHEGSIGQLMGNTFFFYEDGSYEKINKT